MASTKAILNPFTPKRAFIYKVINPPAFCRDEIDGEDPLEIDNDSTCVTRCRFVTGPFAVGVFKYQLNNGSSVS